MENQHISVEQFLHQFAGSLPHASIWALPVALAAGVVASAVCPCTLPMGLGVAGMSGTAGSGSRRNGFFIALCFFAGIVVNLAILSALAGRLGAVLSESYGRFWVVAMLVMSLVLAVIAFFAPRLKANQLASLRRPGLAGAFGYGFVFSLGTSAAPLLVLLSVAAAQTNLVYGLLLGFFFGVGRGLPFLLAGIFAGALMQFVRLGSYRRALQFLSTGALLLVSAYYVKALMTWF